jgi:hypothetical protein
VYKDVCGTRYYFGGFMKNMIISWYYTNIYIVTCLWFSWFWYLKSTPVCSICCLGFKERSEWRSCNMTGIIYHISKEIYLIWFSLQSSALTRLDAVHHLVCVWSVSNISIVLQNHIQAKTCSKLLFTPKIPKLYIKLILVQCHKFKFSYQFTCNTQKYF